MEFAVSVDQWEKEKEGEKLFKYQDLSIEEKTLKDMKVTAIPILIGDLGTILQNQGKYWEKCKITERLRSARILRNFQES